MHAIDCNIFGSRALESNAFEFERTKTSFRAGSLTLAAELFAIHASKPNISIGHPRAIGDADEVFSDHCAKNPFTYFIVLRHLQC